jgi:carboxylate-amine ligase
LTAYDAQPAASADPLSAAALRAVFDRAPAFTVGIEDEVMLLDPLSLELTPRAPQLLERLDGDPRFKLELPASQIEIVTTPSADLAEVARQLHEARRVLAEAAADLARPASAGVHPFSSGIGELNQLARYEQTIEEHAGVAARQLVCALQVHVAIGDADRTLAVYNAARSYLPLLAALAANAPFYEGRDTGLASVRPKLNQLLPRQGIPPALRSWEDYASVFRWGAAGGSFATPGSWWWELRPHPAHGTLEFRVPDAQSTATDAMAVVAVVQALVVWLTAGGDESQALDPAPRWRIEENRWSACRYGVEGTMADLATGAPRPTRTCLRGLLETLAPVAARLDAAADFGRARVLLERNGALAQRELVAARGLPAVAGWLAERFAHHLP